MTATSVIYAYLLVTQLLLMLCLPMAARLKRMILTGALSVDEPVHPAAVWVWPSLNAFVVAALVEESQVFWFLDGRTPRPAHSSSGPNRQEKEEITLPPGKM
jgi:hypothetical protein